MSAAVVLSQAHALLLDFDGPVCSIFAGIPAPIVAGQLRQVLADGGHSDLPGSVEKSEDPFDVLRYATTLGDEEASYVESAFTAHEVEAVASAVPTDGTHDLIRSWVNSGRPIAVVSNNSTAAVSAYLDLYNIRSFVGVISARTGPDISKLKPSPFLIRRAITDLKVDSRACVLIGDSQTDIIAARAAAVWSIGYANKPGKLEKLSSADAITQTMKGMIGLVDQSF
jgi:phosphoglycolate phosphatase